MLNFNDKYHKYKTKYINLKNKIINMKGGNPTNELLLVKAEWCGHCQSFKSTWEKLKKDIKNVKFNTLDADTHKEEIEKLNIQGFPTLLFKNKFATIEYNGNRSYNDLIEFLQQYNN